MFNSKKLGQTGEELVVQYLKKEKYKIIHRNYQNRFGEIDIIALKGFTICFVEVKTRKNHEYGEPLGTIARKQIERIQHMALSYIGEQNLDDYNYRFDIAIVDLSHSDKERQLEYFPNAFDFTA